MVETAWAVQLADEWDELTAALNRWGVIHVAPVTLPEAGIPLSATELFRRLWQSKDPRLHQAGVVLLLTHPNLAEDARSAVSGLAGVTRERAKRRYVAAAALQRMAKTRIATRLGPKPLVEEAYLDELDLPALDVDFGRETLLALSEAETIRYGYDAWGTYWTLLCHFLNEIKRRGWGVVCESEPTSNV